MQTKKKNKKKPLLVLGAMATLGSQFSTELTMLAYANPVIQSSQTNSNSIEKQTKLVAVQEVVNRHHLTDLTTEKIPSVQLDKGMPGETLKQSFHLTKEEVAHLNFNLTLAGPTDSHVVIKVNGVTYLDQTVGRGQLEEPSFFFVEEGDVLVEIEYTVGNGNEVLEGQPWFKLDQMVLNTRSQPSRSLEYRVKGQDTWTAYDQIKGIDTSSIQTKEDTLDLELRYTDESDENIFNLTIEAPKPHNPLPILDKDGLFYLNHFNTLVNSIEQAYVQFNDGDWHPYQPGMALEFINNKCKVNVKVINNFGVEAILPTQYYILPELNQPTIGTPNESNSESNSTDSTEENNSNSESNLTDSTEENNSNSESNSTDSTEENNSNSESNSAESTEENNSNSESNSAESTEEIIKPSLTFTNTTLTIGYGQEPNFYQDIIVNHGTANEVTYKVIENSFDSKKLGQQVVQYQVTYVQDGMNQQFIVERPVEVITVDPTLTFPSETLKVEYGSNLNYESGVTLEVGSATDVKYTLVKSSFNSKKVGEQNVKYELSYKQNGTSYKKTIYRTVEVTGIDPTLTFTSTPLKVKYNSNLNYKSGVKLSRGSATNITYSLVEDSFNPKKVGEQTVQYQLNYTQGGESYSKTINRTIEVTGIDPTLTFSCDTLKVQYGSDFDYKSGATVKTGSATDITYSLVEDSYNPKQVGKQTVQYQLEYKQGTKSYSKTINRTIEVTKIDPTLTFSSTPLTVHYGTAFDYESGATLETGSATDVEYSLVGSSFNPKKVGKQTVKYQLSYKQGTKSYKKTISRTVEVIGIDPTLTFSSTPLTVAYGSNLDYKSGVELSNGSATNVKYSLVRSSFNSKQVGEQTVQYELSYRQGTKSYKKTLNRTIEVTPVDPTLTFSKNTLTARYGKTPNFKTGVTLKAGSATDVTYSIVDGSYNPEQRGTQTVQYQLSYKQSGISYSTIVERDVIVK